MEEGLCFGCRSPHSAGYIQRDCVFAYFINEDDGRTSCNWYNDGHLTFKNNVSLADAEIIYNDLIAQKWYPMSTDDVQVTFQ